MASSNKDTMPLPLADTLRDLAILRASDIDLSAILPGGGGSDSTQSLAAAEEERRVTVERSYEFAREARAAMRILNRDDLEKQGTRIEEVKGGLEEVLTGLETNERN